MRLNVSIPLIPFSHEREDTHCPHLKLSMSKAPGRDPWLRHPSPSGPVGRDLPPDGTQYICLKKQHQFWLSLFSRAREFQITSIPSPLPEVAAGDPPLQPLQLLLPRICSSVGTALWSEHVVVAT
jgi:hypothetical protein